ncbi:MAG: helix-turn-helix transcriptional regulator [Alkalispirochaeta sp.]
MQRKGPQLFPSDQRRLQELGERFRLARLRRKFSVGTAATRAGISRTTLYKVERGDSAVTLGVYVRVLAVYGLSDEIDRMAVDDALGRRLQDLALMPDRT